MRKLLMAVGVLLALCVAYGCGSSDDGNAKGLPRNFNSMPDTARVAWLMGHFPPDSVARFLYRAALGEIPNAKIDTLAYAMLYAYENYTDSALTIFSDEYADYPSRLPLPKRMKALVLSGSDDEMTIGYGLGLEYVNQIRENKLTIQQIDQELADLREVCKNDTMMYKRFITGFKVALEADHGHLLDEKIYQKYKNLK